MSSYVVTPRHARNESLAEDYATEWMNGD